MFDTETTPMPVEVEAEKETNAAIQLAHQFDSYAITTEDQYGIAAIDLKGIKLKTKELDDLRKSLTRPLDESKKRIMDFFMKPLNFLNKAEENIKAAMLAWQRKQEVIRQAEENRLRELQRKEEERIRLEQEKIQKQAEAEAAKGKTDKAFGLTQKADMLTEKADVLAMATPFVNSTVQTVSGISMRKAWKYRIIDETKVPREYLMIDESKLGAMARATKGTVKVDGVEFYADDVIAAGR